MTFESLAWIVGSGSLANVASFTPGSVGVTQATNALALDICCNVPKSTTIAYSTTQQLVTTAWNVLFAAILVVSVFGWTGGRALVDDLVRGREGAGGRAEGGAQAQEGREESPEGGVTATRRFPRGVGRLAAGVGGVFEPIAEDALDRSLAGPLPEALARSLIEHRVLERVVDELLASPEFRASIVATLEREEIEGLVGEVLRSPSTERLLGEAMTSPAVRGALTRQTTTAGEALVARLRAGHRTGDASVDRLTGRRDPPTAWAGIATRGVGLVVDALLVNLVFLAVVGTITLIASLTLGLGHGALEGALAGAGWLVVQAAYFAGFWSPTGATPGQVLVAVGVRHDGRPPGFLRSVVRVVGLWLAIAPLLLGFVPALFDRRRRALQDFLAGTTVVDLTAVE